jgi:F-type H+-transporting ATPase subunit epsilon
VEEEFLAVDAREQDARWVMAKLETGFLRRFAVLQHE